MRHDARVAFGSMPKSSLVLMANEVNCEVNSQDSVFDVCWTLVKHTFRQMSEEDILEIMKCRSALSKDKSVSWKDIMDLDAFKEFFTKDEKEMVEQQTKEPDAANKTHLTFKQQWREKQKTVVAAKASQGGRSKKPHGPLKQLKVIALVPPGAITQAEAKQMLPPNASIWNNWKDGAWCCHQQGHSRESGTWIEYDHRGAALHSIRDCWEKFLDDEGLPLTACPIAGLFSPQQ